MTTAALGAIAGALSLGLVFAGGVPAPQASGAQSSSQAVRVRSLRTADGSLAIAVEAGTISSDGKGGIESVRMFLSFEPGLVATKLKAIPQTKVLDALVISEELAKGMEAVKKETGVRSIQMDVAINRFGHEFGHLADARGNPQPYVLGQVYDRNGSTQAKSGLSQIGVVVAYPLSYWQPDSTGVIQLTLPTALSARRGLLVIWRCKGDKTLWVESIPWAGDQP